MNTKYFIGQEVICLYPVLQIKIIKTISRGKNSVFYEFEQGSGLFENQICTIDELRLIHKKIENICSDNDEKIIKLFIELGIFSKLFEIENFLCDYKDK